MPKVFCFDANPIESMDVINSLRRSLLTASPSGVRALRRRAGDPNKEKGAPRWISPYIDFEPIEFISPSAALVLAAEYDRARRLHEDTIGAIGRLFVVNVGKWDRDVFRTLYEIDFFELLGIKQGLNERAFQTILPLHSGKKTDAITIRKLLDALESMVEAAGLKAKDECFEINGALGEAVENAVLRAYPANGSFAHPHVNRWWMTAAIDPASRTMYVAIYDQGVSIPGSLKDWKRFAGFRKRFFSLFSKEPNLENQENDGEIIRLAIEESASSTNLEKHGKGLNHMKSFIDDCKDGTIRIISRRGDYSYAKGSRPLVRNLAQGIGGTLIEWRVQLQ
ncbi:hypothetical protein [Pararhizobium haloflavum]|uniref:hypothetical protein n=1 Tax=Pararhizobium haloflavum TaxID=2037914 RepID=UPI0012FFD75B|nr:hypothetical protein [Pararhizobium haloflavum]